MGKNWDPQTTVSLEPRDDGAQQHRVDRRVAAARGAALRRHGRRPAAGERGRRQDVAPRRDVPGRADRQLRRRTWPRRRATSNIVFVALNNWQRGDYKPYLLKSTDRGRTFTSIAGNLPARHPVWAVNPGSRQRRPAVRRHRVRAVLHRRMAGSAGCSSAAACRSRRSATWTSRGARPISCSARSAAASTCSTTTARCAKSARRRSREEARLFPLRHAYQYPALGQQRAVDEQLDDR